MRAEIRVGVSIVAVCVAAASAQDDLSRLAVANPAPVTLDFDSVNVADALETVATIVGFELQLMPGLGDAPPVTARFIDTSVEDVLRSVLEAAGVNYRVVERTLIVGAPANAFLDSPVDPRPECSRRVYYPC